MYSHAVRLNYSSRHAMVLKMVSEALAVASMCWCDIETAEDTSWSRIGVGLALSSGLGVGVGGVGPLNTAMSAQFQNSSPNVPPVWQHDFSQVAQSAMHHRHQASGFHPKLAKVATLR